MSLGGEACFMLIVFDLTFFTNCAYISQCALRLSTQHGPIDFDVEANDVNRYSWTTYANNVNILNLEAGTAAIL